MSDDFFSPETKVGQLRRALFTLWQEHKAQETLPTSARFIFYELVSRGILSKQKTGKRRPDQDMSVALTDLREQNLIPWEDIVDETRSLTVWNVHRTIAEGMKEAWQNARLDIWEQDNAPVILCESRSLRGVLENLAYEYHAPIGSTNGQAGGFLHTEVAPVLVPGQFVLYLGDLDFSGGHIEENTRSVLENLTGSLAWERVAITKPQADKAKLEPIQKYDARTKSHHAAIETEALGQAQIVTLLRQRLLRLMPEKRRKRVLEREQKERKQIGQKLGYV
jgi:hypothetical protein